MLICKYFVWFVIYSVMGWIYESAYCTIKNGKWANRGFLFGPLVPIYGVGAIAVSILCEHTSLETFAWWQIFLICMFGSMILEYATSWGLEKLFHACWWDYSEVPLNINGRICLPASLGFGGAGLLVTYFIYPFVVRMTGYLPDLVIEILALVFMALVAADTTLTVTGLNDLLQDVMLIEEEFNQRMELRYDELQENMKERKERVNEVREQMLESRAQHLTFQKRHILSSVKKFQGGNKESYLLRERLREKIENRILK